MSTAYTLKCDDCGWSGKPAKSEAMAAYALRKHSCEHYRAVLARAERVAARKAASGPVRDCACPVANHEHGTHAAYVIDKCRCRPCRDATTAYERQRAKDRAYGRAAYVPADPVREHVRRLGRQGMGWKRVAAAAGLDTSTVWKLLYGDPSRNLAPSKRVRPATADKLLAITLDLAPGAPIDGTGTRRRLQALVAIGWSASELGRRIGMTNTSNVSILIHGRGDRGVQAGTAAKVRALYDELWDTPPVPVDRWQKTARGNALTTARRHGWPPPLAWDDETIDDPKALPDLGEPADQYDAFRKLHLEDVEWLLSQADYTLAGLAARLGVQPDSIRQACYRADRSDLLQRLARNEGRSAA